MSVLYGWAVASGQGLEHTYVTSSDGQAWDCWGPGHNGRLVCSGEANSGQAACLSQKNSHAGILYGLTGVSHQTANRILYPARRIVSGAANYWHTFFLYGTYGLSVIKFRNRISNCLSSTKKNIPGPLPDLNKQAAEQIYLQHIENLHKKSLNATRPPNLSKERLIFRLLQNELKLAVSYRLGSNPRALTILLKAQADLLFEKNFYDRALMAKRIDLAHYAEKINDIAEAAFEKLQKDLGDSLFQAMFGHRSEVKIVDPEVMVKFYHFKKKEVTT